MTQMELVHDYMRDSRLRHGLNTLAQQIYGFDFEAWVQDGYFAGDYIPYSFVEDGKILSNASANRMRFMQNGAEKHYIQIGTVMTSESHRHQGLARKLVEHIIETYENQCDGIYLFSNLDALDFYRKIGFQEGLQYQYALKEPVVGSSSSSRFQPVDRQDQQVRQKYTDAVRSCAVHGSLEQLNKFGLQMFYTAQLSNVYYADDIDCFAVMELSDGTLTLQSVISRAHIPIHEIIARISQSRSRLTLGFSPCAGDAALFEASAFDGGDVRLFYWGKELESIEKERLFFPLLSHA